MRKFIFLITFYFLALVQTSFLIHFNLFLLGYIFVFIIVIFVNLSEELDQREGLFIAGLGGLFLDIFSAQLFGLGILLFIGLAVLTKIIKNYIQIPSRHSWKNISRIEN